MDPLPHEVHFCHQKALGHYSGPWALGRNGLLEAAFGGDSKIEKLNNLIYVHWRMTVCHLDDPIQCYDFKTKQDYPREFCPKADPSWG